MKLPAALGVTDWLPLVPGTPTHDPLAVQLVASVELHRSVAVCPTVILVGLATSATVGAVRGASTVTTVDDAAEPPGPVHVKVYTARPALPGVVLSRPLVA
jgi:hypothetical protein